MLRSKSTDPPTNREFLIKIENDITLLRGEVLRLTELVKILTDFKKKERDEELKSKSSGWIFSNS
tara:strand:- start:8 stop:202 length:195 start_codon:yes stop_codon:yes gene_type:complete